MNTYLIVGLGNPGEEYKNTRHNAGFCCLDLILNDLNIKLNKNKFNALYTIYKNNNNQYIFVEPQTFMNSSGEAVLELVNYYKIDINNIIVIYDDMDLPLGKIRLRNSGSSGGHNGIKNIIELLNSEDIKRIRIGISKDSKTEVVDYVLGRFNEDELKLFNESKENVLKAIKFFIECNDFDKVMSKYN